MDSRLLDPQSFVFCVAGLYHGARTHLALDKDAPETRAVQPPERGKVIEIPEVGGLHHRYERRAA
jgi:putative transposase